MAKRSLAAFTLLALCIHPGAAQAQDPPPIDEREPNNEAGSATIVPPGAVIAGTINPYDVDYWAIEVQAGTRLQIVGADVGFCRDFALLDTDGSTRLAFGDCMENIDSLAYVVPATGRYFVRVTQFDDAPIDHPMRPYAMRFTVGPGGGAAGTAAQVVEALLSGTTAGMPLEFVRQLDAQGNANGILDIGDLRAYLRAQALLPASRRSGT